MNSVSERHANRLYACETAQFMWDKLRSLFADQSILVKADLLGQLHATRHPEGGNVLDTIDKVVQKANEYTAAGGKLTDIDSAAILINAMPLELYPTIQTLITSASTTENPYSFDGVIAHLTESVKLEQSKQRKNTTKA
jgi:gag-polypeptide of LTR copia-type